MPTYQPACVFQEGEPAYSEGYEGEIRFCRIGGKLHQFVRLNNEWHSIPFSTVLGQSIAETVQNISFTTKAVQSTTVSTIICDDLVVRNTFGDDSGTTSSSTSLIGHHTTNEQSHSDYLKNNANDVNIFLDQ